MKINTVLLTKDGRKIGNAIIIGKRNNYNIVKTDYGNECGLTDAEVEELFYIANTNLTPTTKHKNAVTVKNISELETEEDATPFDPEFIDELFNKK